MLTSARSTKECTAKEKLALSLLSISVDNAASRILFGWWSLPVYVIATALSSFRFLVSVARRMSALFILHER